MATRTAVAANLYDLGGYPTVHGVPTAHGRVWRSGRREVLAHGDWAALRERGLEWVVDLRNAAEAGAQEGDSERSASMPERAVPIPLEDADDPEFLAVCGPWLDHPVGWTDYLRFGRDRFVRFFTELAADERGVLIHCSGGRDRTGLVAALLLSLNGVPDEIVVADYERGFRGARAIARPGHAWDGEQEVWVTAADGWSDEEFETRIAERTAAAAAWFAEADVRTRLRDLEIPARPLDHAARRLLPDR